MTSETPTTTIPAAASPIIQFNPASQLPIKLTGSQNFTTWKAQIAMFMHGHDMYGHLDGTNSAPSRTITQTNLEVENPQYKIWFRQDQLIQNALMASVDPTIASTVAGAPSSQKMWEALHTLFPKTPSPLLNISEKYDLLPTNLPLLAHQFPLKNSL